MKTTQKLAAFLFTFERDMEMALNNAGRLIAAGITVYIVDDKDTPASMQALLNPFLGNPKFKYIRTEFNRGGNLNGKECITGILSTMTEISGTFDWLLKIDSDSLIYQPFLDALASGDKAKIYATSITAEKPQPYNQPLCGAAWAMTRATAMKLKKAAEKLPDAPAAEYPEDKTIYKLAVGQGIATDATPLGWYNHRTSSLHKIASTRVVSFGCRRPKDTLTHEAVKRKLTAEITKLGGK